MARDTGSLWEPSGPQQTSCKKEVSIFHCKELDYTLGNVLGSRSAPSVQMRPQPI